MTDANDANDTGDFPCADVALADWVDEARKLKAQGYLYFDFLTAVDQTDAEETPGFDIVLHVYRPAGPGNLEQTMIRTRVPEKGSIASLTGVYAGVRWHERECHEMFGVAFDGFEDGTGQGLRPLLLPNGFVGHPWRKDFVLTSRVSKDWPGAKEPGEAAGGHQRKKMAPPGLPDESWGPR